MCLSQQAAYFSSHHFVEMSSQEPAVTPVKGSRNGRRQPRRNNTPASQSKQVMLSTPPSSPPRISSSSDCLTPCPPNTTTNGNQTTSRKKCDNRSNKKFRENARPPNSTSGNGMSHHRHTSSQPNVASPVQFKDSPHYAGPTFHASPAPSALPMPAFFSKSVPDSDIAATLELDDDDAQAEDSGPELTPSKPKTNPRINHDPSPLDFLFKAAIDARNKTQQSPEAIPKSTVSHTPENLTGGRRQETASQGIFPLELDGSERNTPALSTPLSSYRDKMNALTSRSSQGNPQADMDDVQRKLKTEELKHLLFNPRPQRPASASPHAQAPRNGYFGITNVSRGINMQHHAASGPPTPVSFNGNSQQDASHQGIAYKSPPQTFAENVNPLTYRQGGSPFTSPVNSSRVNHYPSSFQPPFRDHLSRQTYQSPSSVNARLQSASPSQHRDPPDTKKLENDLRRILKLDMTPSMQANGVQSSLA